MDPAPVGAAPWLVHVGRGSGGQSLAEALAWIEVLANPGEHVALGVEHEQGPVLRKLFEYE